MKITCGTDIIEIERVKESIENVGTKFIERVYTEKKKLNIANQEKNKNINTMQEDLLPKKRHLKQFQKY